MEHSYAGIDEHLKVRNLLDGIKMDDLSMIKGQILAMAALRNDFDVCVTLFRDYLLQVKADKVTKQVTIAVVTTSTANHQGHENVTPDMLVKDHYYKVPEYKCLSHAKKLRLKLLHKKWDGKQSDKIPRKPGAGILKKKLQFTKANPAICQIKALLSAVELDGGDDMDVESTDGETQVGNQESNNHTNSALQCGDCN